jgi:hypothetical protein
MPAADESRLIEDLHLRAGADCAEVSEFRAAHVSAFCERPQMLAGHGLLVRRDRARSTSKAYGMAVTIPDAQQRALP